MNQKSIIPFLLFVIAFAYAGQGQTKESINKFAFVSNFKYLILSDEVKNTWVKGSFKADNEAFCLISEVNPSQIPDLLKSFVGREFKVYNVEGETKIAKIVSLKILSEYVPHFSSSQRWEHMDEKEVIKERLDNGVKRLVAELSIGSNFRGLIAHRTGEKDFVVYQKVNDSDKDTLVKSIFRKSAYFTDAQKEFESFKMEKKGRYKETCWLDHGHDLEIGHFSNSNDDFCSTIRVYGNDYAGFAKNSLSVWRIFNGRPNLIYQVADTYLFLKMILDIDSDNKPELILNDMRGYYLVSGKDKEYINTYTYPNYDCGY